MIFFFFFPQNFSGFFFFFFGLFFFFFSKKTPPPGAFGYENPKKNRGKRKLKMGGKGVFLPGNFMEGGGGPRAGGAKNFLGTLIKNF